MEDKPKFMSGRWQNKLMREHPVQFWLLATALAFPVILVLRFAWNGIFGDTAQTVVRVLAVCLLLAFAWLIVVERRRWKDRHHYIDAYLEKRYDQTHERGPPTA